MKLITVANKRTAGLDLWEASAKRHGHDVVILGLGDKRKFGHQVGGNWGLRLMIVQEYLQTINPLELCILTDGYDVLILDSPQTILEKLGKIMRCPLLFAGELFESPEQGHPYLTDGKWLPYLNAGCYAGTAHAILDALQQFRELPYADQFRIDDQRYFTKVLFSRPNLLQIDTEGFVFACLNGVEVRDAQPRSDGSILLKNGNTPSIVHFQGMHKNVIPYTSVLYHDNLQMQEWGKAIHNYHNKHVRFLGDAIVKLGKMVPYIVRDKFIVNDFVIGLAILLSIIVLSLVWFVGRMKDVEYKG